MTNFDQGTRRYFQLLESLGQAVIATDAAGRILYWGDSAAKLYGWSSDEVTGRDILEVTPSEMARAQGAEIMQTLAAGEVWSGEFRVRGRDGQSFLASVTDVPLNSGVAGVSAPSHSPTELVSLLTRFVAAAEKVWPQRVRARIEVERAVVPASEPHLIQLLSLLTLLHAAALDTGTSIEIAARPVERSIFADFGMASGPNSVYVSVGRAEGTYSVLRNIILPAEPAKYARALVHKVGGLLIAGTAPDALNALHLLLPVR